MIKNFVSLHPYFKIHQGKADAVNAMLPQFVEKTAAEKACLFYGFSMSGDELFCREAYENAEGLLAHIDNIGALLAEVMKMADLTRIEVHGPAAELDKLKKPLAHLNPKWFALEVTLPR
jgi:quinol monooxygenase YgiN